MLVAGMGSGLLHNGPGGQGFYGVVSAVQITAKVKAMWALSHRVIEI